MPLDCASCKQPLVAINPAKQDSWIRPHFPAPVWRRPQDCIILLPAWQYSRRCNSTATGDRYLKWLPRPAERFHVQDAMLKKRFGSVITWKACLAALTISFDA